MNVDVNAAWEILSGRAGYSRRGDRIDGPCPVTGAGSTRCYLWAARDGGLLIGCHDHNADSGALRGTARREHLQALGLPAEPRAAGGRRRPTRAEAHARRVQSMVSRASAPKPADNGINWAAAAWRRATAGGDFVRRGRRYLARAAGGFDLDWPGSIRFACLRALRGNWGGRIWYPSSIPLPACADHQGGPDERLVGVVLFAWTAPGEDGEDWPGAVQAEAFSILGALPRLPWTPGRAPKPGHADDAALLARALTGRRNDPAPPPAKRWTIGSTAGRCFVIDAPRRRSGLTLVAEGPTTALALAAAHPDARVLALGGPVHTHVRHARPWLDGQLAGGCVRVAGERGAEHHARAATRALAARYGGAHVGDPWLPDADRPRGWDFADERRRNGENHE